MRKKHKLLLWQWSVWNSSNFITINKTNYFRAGDDVIKQGGDGDYFYVVYKGELDCHK